MSCRPRLHHVLIVVSLLLPCGVDAATRAKAPDARSKAPAAEPPSASPGDTTLDAAQIAATVNDEAITSGDLNSRISLVLATSGISAEGQARQRLAAQVLRGMIDEKLELQEATRLGVEVSKADVDRALATIAERNHMDSDSLKKALGQRGISERAVRDQLRAQVAWAKVVTRELRPKVVVTQDQVDLAMKEAAKRSDAEYALGEIVLPVDSRAQQSQVLSQAQDLVTTLRGGADFAALARQVSIAASANRGGDLGWVSTATILPEYRDRLAALQPGDVSEPILSPSGVVIFQLRGKRVPGQPSTTRHLVVTKVNLAQVVFPLAANAGRDQVRKAETRALQLRGELKGCADVERRGARLAGEGSGALGWLDVGDLPPVLRQVVARIEPDRLSPPFRGPVGVQMIIVCDRKGREEVTEVPATPVPPPPTRDEVEQRLANEQLDRRATRYLRDLRRDAFVDVRALSAGG